MTDQPDAGTRPDAIPAAASPTPPDASDAPEASEAPLVARRRADDVQEPSTPPFEPAEAGSSPPAHTVAREPGAFGAEQAVSRRSSGLRWAVALAGVVVVIAVTAVILALAGGRPSPSIAVGYMPADTISYGEYRLDLPGDQRAKLAAFLSKFPGFADQAGIQTKLYEVFDRIAGLASNNTQTYTANIDPWFGGQIAMGSGPISTGSLPSGPVMGLGGGVPLFVISVRDQAKATEWLTSTMGASLTETQYSGVTVYGNGGGFAIIVTDKVMLVGGDPAVRAAFDSKGEGKLAEDAEFKAAYGTVSRDYVSFSYTEYRALLLSLIGMAGAGSGLESTTVDDEILSMIPAWQASSFRFEDDAIVGDTTYPSIDLDFDAKNKKSTLIGHAPVGTILYAESHDIGPALKAVVERFRKLPELQEGFGQFDTAIGVVGGFDGAFGWWGDAAVAVSKNADGSIGGGLLIQPTDAQAASRLFATLRSFALVAGAQTGIKLRDVEHGGATITIVDFSAAVPTAADIPPGLKAELAYTVTDGLVVVGYGETFVKSVLDAGPGPSLADDGRFNELLKRGGEEGIGLSYVDIRAIRELVEPLVKDAVPAEQWAFYEREVLPYVLPIDAMASGARVDGDLDRLSQFITVK